METTYAIVVDGTVVGAARLEPRGPSTEVGIWVSAAVRGTGVGRAAMCALLARARADGVGRIVAETTADNTAAQALVSGLGGTLERDGDAVHSDLPTLEP